MKTLGKQLLKNWPILSFSSFFLIIIFPTFHLQVFQGPGFRREKEYYFANYRIPKGESTEKLFLFLLPHYYYYHHTMALFDRKKARSPLHTPFEGRVLYILLYSELDRFRRISNFTFSHNQWVFFHGRIYEK